MLGTTPYAVTGGLDLRCEQYSIDPTGLFLYIYSYSKYCNMYAMEWPLLGNVQAL
jgi:hypothetical protein